MIVQGRERDCAPGLRVLHYIETVTSMAQRTTILVTCDLPHGEDVEAVDGKSRLLSYQGYRRKLDLCAEHLAALEAFLAPYLEAGEALPSRVEWPQQRTPKPRPVAPQLTLEHLPRVHDREAVRAWAKENGYAVADRGRIAQRIIDDYEAAQQTRSRRRATV